MHDTSKKFIRVVAKIKITNELFSLPFLELSDTILTVKSISELLTGIPKDLQRLSFLDDGFLGEDVTLRSLKIVPGSILNIDLPSDWNKLIKAVVCNDLVTVYKEGISSELSYHSLISDHMTVKQRYLYLNKRINVSLMVSCSRGHIELAKSLISFGARFSYRTSFKRSALHIAAASNRYEVFTRLIKPGSDIDYVDVDGFTPLGLAEYFGHKICARHLFLFRWKQRASNLKAKYLDPPMKEFQYFDSSNPRWLTNDRGQIYLSKETKLEEFLGSAINAPKRKWHRKSSTIKI